MGEVQVKIVAEAFRGVLTPLGLADGSAGFGESGDDAVAITHALPLEDTVALGMDVTKMHI